MKASRFVKVFAKEVDKWERALSLILECTEMILTVQRQWMYLENIFTGACCLPPLIVQWGNLCRSSLCPWSPLCRGGVVRLCPCVHKVTENAAPLSFFDCV